MLYQRHDNTKFLGKRIFYKQSCFSTQEEIYKFIKKHQCPEGLIAITDNQTNGRGENKQKSWISQPFQNLTFSFLLHPYFLAAQQHFYLNMMVSLAIQDVLQKWTHTLKKEGFKIKWPNDIYYHKKKLGGILIENQCQNQYIKRSVIGIGLNVNTKEKNSHRISLNEINGSFFSLYHLLNALLLSFENYYSKLSLNTDFTQIYLKHLFQYKKKMLFQYKKKIFLGKITDITIQGLLGIMHDENKKTQYYPPHTIQWIID